MHEKSLKHINLLDMKYTQPHCVTMEFLDDRFLCFKTKIYSTKFYTKKSGCWSWNISSNWRSPIQQKINHDKRTKIPVWVLSQQGEISQMCVAKSTFYQSLRFRKLIVCQSNNISKFYFLSNKLFYLNYFFWLISNI